MAVAQKLRRFEQPDQATDDAANAPTRPYQPPFRQVLALLGLTETALQAETVTIAVPDLLRVMNEAFVGVEVDEAWYLDRYPDVHAAILAGRTPSAAAHFRAAGFREGRLPGPLPFDAAYYFETYKDLASAFDRTDTDALRHHYETRGYQEGRAGLQQHFGPAARWAGGLQRD